MMKVGALHNQRCSVLLTMSFTNQDSLFSIIVKTVSSNSVDLIQVSVIIGLNCLVYILPPIFQKVVG